MAKAWKPDLSPGEGTPWEGERVASGKHPFAQMQDFMKGAGYGMILPDDWIGMLTPQMQAYAEAFKVPRVYTRKMGEAMLRQGTEGLSEAQQARSGDLRAQLASTYGLRSGMAAEGLEMDRMMQAKEQSRMQTAMELAFREQRSRELMDRLMFAWMLTQKHPPGTGFRPQGGGVESGPGWGEAVRGATDLMGEMKQGQDQPPAQNPF
jgi:hypothetical protein